MNGIRLGLALTLLWPFLATTARSQTVGEVVMTDGEVCGWTGDRERLCGDREIELREKSSIDRGMTVRTGDGGYFVCVMTIDERAVDGGGAVMMRPETMIRLSGEAAVDMEQLLGVIRVVLPPKRDRQTRILAGRAWIVLRGTYVEIRVDETTGLTTVGVLEGWVTVTGLPETPPVLPETLPEGATRARVYAGEQVDVTAEGAISPPRPFPTGAPAADPTVLIEDDGIPPEPGTQGPGPEDPILRPQICDLPRGVCN